MSGDGSSSLFHRVLLPAIILQSILIGGGYSTGREVVEYAARFGPAGWLSVLVIFLGFSLMSVLCFELARVFRVYDYKRWIQLLIGRLWPLFDLLIMVMILLVIAVMAAAVGNILEQTLSVPNAMGIGIAFVVVAVLAYFGETVIERFKTVGTLLLYVGYVVFAGVALSLSWSNVVETLAGGGAGEPVARADVVGSGILYVGYNLAVYPAAIFVLHRQRDRRDTLASGLVAGVMMTLPFALTFLCLMGAYPDQGVLGNEVPWLQMLEGAGAAWVIVLYGLVVGWTLIETSVGSIHAVIDRVHKNMEDLPWVRGDDAGGLAPGVRAFIAAGILLGALLLSRFGIIALVATGYRLVAYGFILLLAIPLLTVGVYRIWRAPGSGEEKATLPASGPSSA